MIIPALVPRFIQKLYPGRVWRIESTSNELFLTFDDGPHPDITPRVLDLLNEYNAKATFFCIGDRVKQYPTVVEEILAAGHTIGNHTQHHLNGWKTPAHEYANDVSEAQGLIKTTLFRPPYGRITRNQERAVRGLGVKIIMWTILSADYDQDISPTDVSKRVNENIEKGSIIVFHDSEKAAVNMLFALTELLKKASLQGFKFRALEY